MEELVKSTQDSRPVPDPTLLTTQQLLREMTNLKEVIFTRLDGNDKAIVLFNENLTRVPTETDKAVSHLREVHEGRFDAMDKAILLLQSWREELPRNIDEKVESLKVVHDEKFGSIQTQFRERDVRSEQSSKDSKVAVDAALQAQKEAASQQNESNSLANAKMETSFTKQIDQIGALITANTKASDSKIDDLKDRIGRIESIKEGTKVADTSHQTSAQFVITVLAVIISFVSVAVAIFVAAHK